MALAGGCRCGPAGAAAPVAGGAMIALAGDTGRWVGRGSFMASLRAAVAGVWTVTRAGGGPLLSGDSSLLPLSRVAERGCLLAGVDSGGGVENVRSHSRSRSARSEETEGERRAWCDPRDCRVGVAAGPEPVGGVSAGALPDSLTKTGPKRVTVRWRNGALGERGEVGGRGYTRARGLHGVWEEWARRE